MKRKLAWPVALLVIFVAVFGLIQYYQSVQHDYRQDRKAAVERALRETPLASVHQVEPGNGESAAMALFGADEEGREMLVLVSDEVHFVYVDEGLGRNAVEVYWRQEHEDGQLLHVVPIMRDGEVMWEVFSLRPTERGERYFYDYYRFADGQHAETLSLSLKQ